MKTDFLYRRIAEVLEQRIHGGVLAAGTKLPSLRAVQQQYGVSLNTAKQAYWELERQQLIEARPQSGFYVRPSRPPLLALPATSTPPTHSARAPVEALISRVYHTLADPALTQLSVGVPDPSMLPVARLTRSLNRVLRTLPGAGTSYEEVVGSAPLRTQLARWAATSWGSTLRPDELLTTAGAMSALTYCLLATTQPGDTVAVESPVYVWALQLIHSLGRHALELPTHPETGIDLAALTQALPQIQACLLIPNFSIPLGSCMPDAHKQTLVRLLTAHQIPLIEDDVYGDLYYGSHRPRPCKAWDEQGLVLWCSSVSKTLAPGYRVGWVAPGRFYEQIRQLKLVQAIASPPLHQAAVADFLTYGRYEQHLRRLRQTLHANCQACLQAVAAYFPVGTRVTQPTGGFTLWVELPGTMDTQVVFEAALRQGISVAPGRLFTQHNQFNNCLRLGYGLPWSAAVESRLRQLAQLMQHLSPSA